MYWRKMRGEYGLDYPNYVKVVTIFASEGIEEWTNPLIAVENLPREQENLYPLEMLTRHGNQLPWLACPSVEHIIFPKSLLKIETRAFKGWGLHEVDLSNTKLTEISIGAFMYCLKLTSVVFPEGLKHISPNAFADCANLGPELTFPKGLLTIDWHAFHRCKNLKRINISRHTLIDRGLGQYAAFDIGVEINYID